MNRLLKDNTKRKSKSQPHKYATFTTNVWVFRKLKLAYIWFVCLFILSLFSMHILF